MGIFSKPEVIILKESNDAKEHLDKLESLLPKANKDVKDKIQKEIGSWVDSARVFGYVPNGFYLVDSANTVESYGDSLDKIIENNIEVQTSYSFYARWSFLIEIIEAPGTNVVTSFRQ